MNCSVLMGRLVAVIHPCFVVHMTTSTISTATVCKCSGCGKERHGKNKSDSCLHNDLQAVAVIRLVGRCEASVNKLSAKDVNFCLPATSGFENRN